MEDWRIVEYEGRWRRRWDDFVDASRNATFLFKRDDGLQGGEASGAAPRQHHARRSVAFPPGAHLRGLDTPRLASRLRVDVRDVARMAGILP